MHATNKKGAARIGPGSERLASRQRASLDRDLESIRLVLRAPNEILARDRFACAI